MALNNNAVDRRRFVASATGAAFLSNLAELSAQTVPVPIIDTHIHLFDQTRPQGAPYSAAPGNTAPALPTRYRALAAPLGIVGAIEIDASPWIEDNLWVLETIASDPMMVGTAGNLEPDKPEFREYIERYHRNRLFLGYRYGNIWGRNISTAVEKPEFIEGLKITAELGLVLDSGNPRPDLITALLKAKDRVPDLRIVLDHMATLAPVAAGVRLSQADRTAMEGNLRELAKRPNVFFKISEYLQLSAAGSPILDAGAYKPVFDYLIDLLGENRVVFGSDWPNGNAVNNLSAIVQIARDYFATKPFALQEKYFWRNSIQAYSWVHRDPSQPIA